MKKILVTVSCLVLGISAYAQVINDGTYYIKSNHSGNCISLESSKDLAKVEQEVCEEVLPQQFYFSHISDDP